MKIDKLLEMKQLVINPLLLEFISNKNVGLNEFLLLVYFFNEDNKSFDVDKISKYLKISENDLLKAFNSLIKNKIITISSKKGSNGKINEIISLDMVYQEIETKLLENENESLKKNIYELFEKELGRPLSSMQFEIIRAWLEDKKYPEELIIGALKEAVFAGNNNFRYIDKILFEWNKKGFKKMKDVENHLAKRRNDESSNKELFDYNWLEDEDN